MTCYVICGLACPSSNFHQSMTVLIFGFVLNSHTGGWLRGCCCSRTGKLKALFSWWLAKVLCTTSFVFSFCCFFFSYFIFLFLLFYSFSFFLAKMSLSQPMRSCTLLLNSFPTFLTSSEEGHSTRRTSWETWRWSAQCRCVSHGIVAYREGFLKGSLKE